jgi:hypothetical protein
MSSNIATQYPMPPPLTVPPEAEPDYDNIIVQDDIPVDSIYAEKLMRLLVESIRGGWPKLYPNRRMLPLANVGLFYKKKQLPVVPDVMVSLDVEAPSTVRLKPNRSYFVWNFGKTPDVVVEIVSNAEGEELGIKFDIYSGLAIPYYVVWDPEHFLSDASLSCYTWRDKKFHENGPWFPGVGIGVKEWVGEFEGVTTNWLRWCDQPGNLLLTAAEQIAEERERAAAERQRADAERQRSEKLAEQLRALGVEPQA